MLDTVKINHVQHISFTQSRLTDAVSVILSELLSYEHPPKPGGHFLIFQGCYTCVQRINVIPQILKKRPYDFGRQHIDS